MSASLWSEDYDGCIEYANQLINATATRRPVFMAVPQKWITIFTQGNSKVRSILRSIGTKEFLPNRKKTRDLTFLLLYTQHYRTIYLYTEAMCEDLYNESIENGAGDITASVHAKWGAYADLDATGTVR